MNISPICTNSNINFSHANPWSESTYNTKEKLIVAGTTAVGALAGVALLAKISHYSLSPNKIFKNTFSNSLNTVNTCSLDSKWGKLKNKFFNKKNDLIKDIKKTYMYKAPYDEWEVVTIGAGSCAGGLAGGYIIDKDKANRKAKKREALLQIANISVPIFFTAYMARMGKYLGNRFLEKTKGANTLRTRLPKAIGAIVGLFTGVYVGNIVGNKINDKIFNKGMGRDVQISDFSAHLDDFCMAARQIDDKNKIIHGVSTLIPFALMIAGNEVGNKKAE